MPPPMMTTEAFGRERRAATSARVPGRSDSLREFVCVDVVGDIAVLSNWSTAGLHVRAGCG
jgi:hypothetical protein